MFSVNQILALGAVLSSASAACVPRGGSSSKSSSVLAVSTAASTSLVASSLVPTVSSSVAPVAYTTSATSLAASSSAAAVETSTSASSSIASTPVASSTVSSAVAVVSSSASPLSSAANSTSDNGTKYFVVFGDSYSSTGFYIEGGNPSAASPLGSGDQTTTGGLNWVGMVTEKYNSSLVLTYDWAYYGADVSNDIINTGVTTDVIAQVAEFEKYLVPAPTDVPWTADNLLAAVWIGINDIGECFWESAEYATCPIDEVQAKYFSLLQDLYNDGVRNFVLNSVPPFYKAPAFDQQTNLDSLISNLDSYNSKLVSNLDQFKSNNTGVTAQVFNTTSYFWDVLDDPTTYGLESDITCSNADGTTCVWYDNYHPGQAIHTLVAKGFASALAGFF
ncbi:Thermolabile hemolysin [Cytospora mali]|uniref:Thermolabile hemolysin n=1 Tax=Cytospora mali TaxID=578113 RepID=A0A194VRR7_CYTMA|nr:Thermolabile hemolysin [Valsa mali]